LGKVEGDKVTPQQEVHLEGLKWDVFKAIDKKYRRGAKEHGGILSDMSEDDLLDNAIDEAIDQVAYLFTLKAKRQKR
jgi:hypothetical protein